MAHDRRCPSVAGADEKARSGQSRTRDQGWWAGRESNPQSFRGGFTDRWARHMPVADPADKGPPGGSRVRPFILQDRRAGPAWTPRYPRPDDDGVPRGYARYVL